MFAVSRLRHVYHSCGALICSHYTNTRVASLTSPISALGQLNGLVFASP